MPNAQPDAKEYQLPNDLVIESTTDDETSIRSAYGLGAPDPIEAAVDAATATASAAAPGEEPPVREEPAPGQRTQVDAAAEPVVAAPVVKQTPAQLRTAKIQADINAATRQKHDTQREIDAAKRELDTLRAEAAALKAGPAAVVAKPAVPAADQPAPVPEIEAFDDLTEYQTAMTAWAAGESTRAARVAVQAREAQLADEAKTASAAASQQARARAEAQFRDQVAALTAEDPTFGELLAANDQDVSHVMEAAILTSPRGAEITRYLLQHPEEAEQLAQDTVSMGPEGLSLVTRTLESRLAAAPSRTGPAAGARRTTETPAPITPVSTGSPASTKPLDELPIEEFMRIRNRQESEREGRM